uniref:Uncharacterized protein n=1 Tax=Zea mays TaxID=4577 RepID=A0A804QNR7_MAIZE
MQKQDDALVQHFCDQVGVRRQVFKVWMHNNKHIGSGGRRQPPPHLPPPEGQQQPQQPQCIPCCHAWSECHCPDLIDSINGGLELQVTYSHGCCSAVAASTFQNLRIYKDFDS